MPICSTRGGIEFKVCNTNQHDSPGNMLSVDARNIVQCCRLFCHFLSFISFYEFWYVTAESFRVIRNVQNGGL